VITSASTEIAYSNLAERISDGPWTRWAARLLPTVAVEAVIAWLDAGQPDPDQAAHRIGQIVDGVVQAAHPADRAGAHRPATAPRSA
jgi:hypothetical protein